MNEDLQKWAIGAVLVIAVILLLAVMGGCTEVSMTTGGVDVCQSSGDTGDCSDEQDNSDNSDSSDNSATTTN